MLRAWLSLAILLLALTPELAKADAVARVAWTVGESRRIDATGKTELLRLGAPLSEGDRIITGRDSVAIIVFGDDGRVSLRADSELLIRRYRIDPSGAETQLQLDLVRGAVRQISGQAARLQPERYRLNTPIAAIGVRGTDFLASISSESMDTFVHEGMIVVLPNLAGCSNSVPSGRCIVPVASVSAGDAGPYLRMLSSGKIERRTVGPEELEKLFGLGVTKVGASTDATGNAVASGRVTNTQPRAEANMLGSGADALAGVLVTVNGNHKQINPPPVTGSANLPEPVVIAGVGAPAVPPTLPDPVVVPAPQPAPVVLPAPQPAPVVLPAPQPAPVAMPVQLAWGRFSNSEAVPLQLPGPVEVAVGAGRHPVVGEFGNPESGSLLGLIYGLWRSGPSDGLLNPGLKGQVQFGMAAGEAYFQQGTQNSVAQIQSGKFGVDFDRSRFDASLSLSHASTGPVGLNVSGSINDQGVFRAGGDSQRVAGALSLDGKEAAFLFARTVDLGVFRGVTLWNTR